MNQPVSFIDPFSGQVNATVTAATLPGRNDLNVWFDLYYNSAVVETATRRNAAESTGVLGLGWGMPFEAIYADLNFSGDRNDSTFILVTSDHKSKLICTGFGPDGSWLMQCENHVFWQIRYYPDTETWLVVKDNGNSFYFGEEDSGRDTVQWAVKAQNWIGASRNIAGQRQYAIAWNLSRITNRFGDEVEYSYSNTNVPAGTAAGRNFTQASYLTRIKGVEGDTLDFVYDAKTTAETPFLHNNPAARMLTRIVSKHVT